MGSVFYLIGIGVAGFSGYSNLDWYFIFIASSIMSIGYLIIRAPQVYSIISNDGKIAIPKLLLAQITVMSIITAPIYFIATLFS